MASERERLGEVYEGMGDRKLLELAGAPEELTDEGRGALAGEMRRRGLAMEAGGAERGVTSGPVVMGEEEEREQGFGAGIPGVIPTGASAVEQALEPGGEERQGMARLISFYDGIELGQACEALEGAGVAFNIEEVAGDAMSGAPPHFAVWVETAAQEPARGVMREAMGLFPAAEVEGAVAEESDGVVGLFEARSEAEEVLGMLAAEGFAARVEEQDLGFGVVVAPREQERALEVVASRMGVE